jgi:hypothetical protein
MSCDSRHSVSVHSTGQALHEPLPNGSTQGLIASTSRRLGKFEHMTPGEQLVLAANAYAEQMGEGQGHWLIIHLQDGKCLRGPCYNPQDGIMRMEVYTEEDGVNHAEPVWVNLSMVTHVQIEW